MSKPRYSWWPYVKDMIRQYPRRLGQSLTGIAACEQAAVQAAIEQTERMSDGQNRLKVIRLVLWDGTHYIAGAALQVPCGEKTAKRWHADFIKAVAQNFRCDGLIDLKDGPLEP